MKKDLLILIGSHGTGKTTTLEKLKSEGWVAYHEDMRDLLTMQLTMSERQSMYYQRKHEQWHELTRAITHSNYHQWALDRCNLDTLAYSKALGVEMPKILTYEHEIGIYRALANQGVRIAFKVFSVNDDNRDWIYNDRNRLPAELDDKWAVDLRAKVDAEMLDVIRPLLKDNGFHIV